MHWRGKLIPMVFIYIHMPVMLRFLGSSCSSRPMVACSVQLYVGSQEGATRRHPQSTDNRQTIFHSTN
jgi:hypothetical protein